MWYVLGSFIVCVKRWLLSAYVCLMYAELNSRQWTDLGWIDFILWHQTAQGQEYFKRVFGETVYLCTALRTFLSDIQGFWNSTTHFLQKNSEFLTSFTMYSRVSMPATLLKVIQPTIFRATWNYEPKLNDNEDNISEEDKDLLWFIAKNVLLRWRPPRGYNWHMRHQPICVKEKDQKAEKKKGERINLTKLTTQCLKLGFSSVSK